MKGNSLIIFFLLCLTAPAGGVRAAEEQAPDVVVSIKPIHSLIAAVMEGAGEPRLLIEGGSSPHSYALRPSDARNIARAQLVVWVGETLEGFLEKPLSTLGSGAVQLELAEALKEHLLPIRAGGVWEEYENHVEHEEEGIHHGEDHEALDPHLWLDPALGGRIVDLVVPALRQIDPAHADLYRDNGERLKTRLDALGEELQRQVEPVKEIPYIVFHDGYQYFEKAFSLSAMGSVTLSPDRTPGARRIREIRGKVQDLGARCVFSEPQFEPRLVATVIEGSGAATGVLDPLGADIPAGPNAYFQMMRRLADSLVECLQGRPD